jgi:diketogulonate reductase-like aldo/keto reductase
MQALIGDDVANPATRTVEAHGAAIPVIGFGTGFGLPPEEPKGVAEIVASALWCGYRHLDCARKYGTEEAVGEGLQASGVPREEVFITTKVSHENLREADFARSTEASLRALRIDQADLLLIHWPNPQIPLDETIGALNRAKRQGLTRHIGVANFPSRLLEQAIGLSAEPLVTDQVEYHAHLDQSTMLETCRRHGMILTAYCPLGRGRLMQDPVLGEIARQKGRTVAQVALRWLMQQDRVVPIPRSSNPQRVAENLDVFDFELTAEETSRIDALRGAGERIADPAGRAPAWD